MKKVVLKLDLHDEKGKKKVMKTASGLSGIDSVAMDMKDKKLTLTGDIDPVAAVAKLRKICNTEIVTVGPAKEPEKKKEDDKKKDDQPKKGDDNKKKDSKEDGAGKPQQQQQLAPFQNPLLQHQPVYFQPPHPMQHQAYYHNHPMLEPYYYNRPAVEDPNSCVIC